MVHKAYATPLNGILYGVYALAVVVLVRAMNLELADDPHVRLLASSADLSTFVTMYVQWSSRTIIQPLLFFLCAYPLVFKILAAAVLLWLPLVLADMWNAGQRNFWVVLCVCLLYPFTDMRSSGWVSTFANYLFPLAACIAFTWFILRGWKGGRVSKTARILFLPLLLLAVNHEQSFVVMTCVIATFLLLGYRKTGRLDKYLLLSLAICGLSGLSIALCPGNTNRVLFEAATYDPNFSGYSFAYKAYRGFITTAHRYFFSLNTLFFIFSLLLALCLREKYRNRQDTWLFFVPCAFPLLYTLITAFLGKGEYLLRLSARPSDIAACACLAVAVLLCLLTLYYLYLLFGRTRSFYITAALLCLGFATRMVVGFSPVLFIAGLTRASLFSDFALIMGTLALFAFAAPRNNKAFFIALVCCAFLQVAKNLIVPLGG